MRGQKDFTHGYFIMHDASVFYNWYGSTKKGPAFWIATGANSQSIRSERRAECRRTTGKTLSQVHALALRPLAQIVNSAIRDRLRFIDACREGVPRPTGPELIDKE